MIQIAVISDIHANIIALEAVLKDIEERNISQVYCLGDLVDFAPWGNEVIDLMQQRGIPCLLGNHDERIAFNQPVIPLAHHDAEETANRDVAINYSKRTITPEHKNWLKERPYQLELSFKTGAKIRRILLVHASPSSNDEYIYASHDQQALFGGLRNKDIDVLCMGHTHLSYIQQYKDVWFVNCGSVGRSKEKDRKAAYSILTISEAEVKAEIVKVAYSLDEVTAAIHKSEIPDFYADFLLNR